MNVVDNSFEKEKSVFGAVICMKPWERNSDYICRYIFQYKNAPLWGDRDEAIDYFKEHMDDKAIVDIMK